LRWNTWEVPEAAVVKISVTWVTALAVAGGTPKASRLVVDRTPKAMPSAPSTSWATKPIRAKVRKVSLIRPQPQDREPPRDGGPLTLCKVDGRFGTVSNADHFRCRIATSQGPDYAQA